MGEQQEECRRRHAVEAGRLAEARRPVALKLLPELGGKSGDAVKGEVVRDRDALLFAEGGDVDLLALEIDGIARIDGELFGDLDLECADLGPNGSERCEADVWIREQLVGAALPAIAIDGEAALDGFVGREGESLQQSFAIGEGFRLRGEGCCALSCRRSLRRGRAA